MIDVENLTYAYPGREVGIGPLSLTSGPGEILNIKGRSGSGKSTIARCISGIIPHLYKGSMQGSVLLNGHKTVEKPLWKLAEIAGFVFQNPSLQMLGNSVEDEIIMGLENLGLEHGEIKERLSSTLDRFGLGSMAKRNPVTLSGGEQQKLALAAITSRNPSCLILDEPLSMLDVTSADEFVQMLATMSKEGKTIVIFEHRSDYFDLIPFIRTIEIGCDHLPDVPDTQFTTDLEYPYTNKKCKLKISDLNISINGNRIINNLNMNLKSGESTAIVGRNGCGKTTLLRAIAGLQKFEGNISIGSGDLDFGIAFQNSEFQLFNSSVKNEILYNRKNRDSKIYEWLLQSLGLEEYENYPPLMLSEGEKKRVALASILIGSPDHGILLDEPSLGQDKAHRIMLANIAKKVALSGRIALMATHDLHLAAMADRIILMGRNGVIADGKPGEIFQYKDAWEHAGLKLPEWMKKEYRKLQ